MIAIKYAKVAAVLTVSVALAAGLQQAFAASSGPDAVVTSTATLGAQHVVVQTETTEHAPFTSNEWQPLTTATLTVPTGQRALALATFSGESQCWPHDSAVCFIRVIVDGNPNTVMQPYDGAYSFDTSRWPDAASTSRAFSGLAAGTHTFTVEARIQYGSPPAAKFILDDWLFQVESWRQS